MLPMTIDLLMAAETKTTLTERTKPILIVGKLIFTIGIAYVSLT